MSAGLAGCVEDWGAPGTLVTYLRSGGRDLSDFDSCSVTVGTVAVKLTAAGRVSFDVDSESVDLVESAGPNGHRVAELELDPARYEYVELGFEDVEARLKSGEAVSVASPDAGFLRFDQNFEIGKKRTTTAILAFAPEQRDGGYRFVSLPELVEVRRSA